MLAFVFLFILLKNIKVENMILLGLCEGCLALVGFIFEEPGEGGMWLKDGMLVDSGCMIA